ncbi:MAG: glycosyltransferase family 2 protein [Proteobacteria bacterium]|nr:glycosyltransferase family 2 protein [Pseudomonadota bacterium]NBX86363.1 glycosyltransferase family 2 protein [Pseudomonadota bacterium]
MGLVGTAGGGHKLSILVPCYNEFAHLESVINTLRTTAFPCPIEIVVVDDGSTDGTTELMRKMQPSADLKLVFHARNQGKGAALRTAIGEATGTVCIVQDADLEYDPSEIAKVVQPILDGRADVVYGSRFRVSAEKINRAERVHYFTHFVANQVLTMLSNMLTNLNLSDMETCYKAFRVEVLKGMRVSENRFGFEPEITARVGSWRPKLRVYEIGISYQGRTYEEGKKIGWKDGLRAIWCIVKYNTWGRHNGARG